MITLGEKVTDRITGFTGVATARAEYLNGCVRIQIEPRVQEDGKLPEAQWIDEQRLTDTSEAEAGGPGPVPPPRDAPRF
jgi:hypothetical protein